MLDVQIPSSRNNPKVKTMGRKEIMRVVTVFTSLVILGAKIMPFTNAANTGKQKYLTIRTILQC